MKIKTCLTYAIFFLFIGVIIAPNINAISIEKTKENNDSACLGRVSGMVMTGGFMPMEISGAKFVLKGGLSSRITFSGPLGFYRFNFVTVGRQYTLTVSHPDYKTESTSFYLSADDPFKIISFTLYEKEVRSKTTEEKECLGSIWGNTGIGYIWGFSPVRFVKVEAGGKSTISGPFMGEYRIRNLPLGTYTVTGTKKGYETFTDTVTLSEKHHDKQVFVNLQPIDVDVKKRKTISLIKNINNIELPKITNFEDEKLSIELEKNGYGIILGTTMWQKGWCMGELPGVKITAYGEGVPRIKKSNMLAHFKFILPLDKTYTITGTKKGYEADSKSVTLSSDQPIQFVDLVLKALGKNYDINEKNKIETLDIIYENEPACFGTILGKTGANSWSGWGPVNNVKITIGSRTKYSKPHFFFTGLSLGQTYTVTASKAGWETQTKEVTLTEEEPIANIQFDLEDNGDNIVKAVIVKEKNTLNNDGIISGDIVAPGYSLLVGVPGINVACGINREEYVKTVTDYCGEFEFTDLPYDNSGTEYEVWTLKSPGLIFLPSSKKVTINSDRPERNIRIILPFVFFGRGVKNRAAI